MSIIFLWTMNVKLDDITTAGWRFSFHSSDNRPGNEFPQRWVATTDAKDDGAAWNAGRHAGRPAPVWKESRPDRKFVCLHTVTFYCLKKWLLVLRERLDVGPSCAHLFTNARGDCETFQIFSTCPFTLFVCLFVFLCSGRSKKCCTIF